MKVSHVRNTLCLAIVLAFLVPFSGLGCGSAADLNAADCCSKSCPGPTGLANPQACCNREAVSKVGVLFGGTGPAVHNARTAVIVAQEFSSLLIDFGGPASSSPWNHAPPKAPPRDIITLTSSLLI